MLLDGVEGDHELPGNGLVRPPAASIVSTSSSGWSADRPGPAPPRGPGRTGDRPRGPDVKGELEPLHAAARDPGGLAVPHGPDQPGQQRGHRRSLVGEDPDIALRAGQREHVGEGVRRVGVLAAGGQRQRRSARPRSRCRADPGRPPRRTAGPAARAPRRAAAGPAAPGPAPGIPARAGSAVHLRRAGQSRESTARPRPRRPGPAAAGPAAPGPDEQASRHRRGMLGFADRLQRSGRIAGGLPDPGQRHPARGRRWPVEELAA